MPPGQVRDIGVRLADALAAAHASGVLHRDIKPANILVNRFGMVGLSDFGLASIISARGDQTASREALTPAYSSPETFRGEEPGVLADVYSLAATLYALLSGLPPHFTPGEKAPGFATLMRLHDEPVRDVPGTPPDLMALLRAAMSPDRRCGRRARRRCGTHWRPWRPRPGRGGRARSAAAGRQPACSPPRARPAGALAAAYRTGPPPSDGGPTTSARHRQDDTGRPRSGRSARRAGLAAGLAVIAAAAIVLGARFFGHAASPGAGATAGASAGQGPRGPAPAPRRARRPARHRCTGSRPRAPAARRRPSGGPWPGARRSRSASTGWS